MPKRSVIVIVSTLSALLLMFFVLAISEMFVRDDDEPAQNRQQ